MTRIARCRTRAEWRAFERVPEMLHGHRPDFVVPLPGDEVKLSRDAHPFHRHGSLRAYLALQDGRPVGRIASIVNRTHNELHGERVGFFGFFDFVDEQVAGALLRQACDDAREYGFEAIRGPVNPTQNDECGLQVRGFGTGVPYLKMPFNPPEYVDVYASLGLEGRQDLLAYTVSRERLQAVLQRCLPLEKRLEHEGRASVRALSLGALDAESAMVAELFNETFGAEWGFMPFSAADVRAWAGDLLRFLSRDAVLVVEDAGRPVGLAIWFPDLNEHLASMRRVPRWLRWPYLAWRVVVHGSRRARLAVFGIVPGYRGELALLLFAALVRRGLADFSEIEVSWTQEQNPDVNRFLRRRGFQVYKRFRVYEMAV